MNAFDDVGEAMARAELLRRQADRMAILASGIGLTGIVFMMLGLHQLGAVMAGVSIAMCFGMPWATAALVIGMIVMTVSQWR